MKRWYALALLVTVVLVAVAYFKRTEVSGYVRFRVERLIGPILAGVLDRDAKNLDRARQRIATQETARFIIKNMPAVASFETKFELLQHSLQNVDTELKDATASSAFTRVERSTSLPLKRTRYTDAHK